MTVDSCLMAVTEEGSEDEDKEVEKDLNRLDQLKCRRVSDSAQ